MQLIEEDASKLQFGDDFANCPCLMTAETLILLQFQKHAFPTDSSSSQEKSFSSLFHRTLRYATDCSRYSNQETIREVRSGMSDSGLVEYEMAQIGNLGPETAEEAKCLIPSLCRISDAQLQSILDVISNASRFM